MDTQDDDDEDKPEGFWCEFFLLRPDRPTLRRILDAIGPDDLVNLEVAQTRQLFARAVAAVRGPHGPQQQQGGGGPDGHALEVSTCPQLALTYTGVEAMDGETGRS